MQMSWCLITQQWKNSHHAICGKNFHKSILNFLINFLLQYNNQLMLNLKIFAFGVFMVWRQLTKASITVLINNININISSL